MIELKFNIDNQNLTVEKVENRIIANSVNYLQASFHFANSKDWEGLVIYAEFSWNRKNYWVQLQNENAFYIPWQVINIPGFTVDVFGSISEALPLNSEENENEIILNGTPVIEANNIVNAINKRITTNLVQIKVEQSGDLFGDFVDVTNQQGESLNDSE